MPKYFSSDRSQLKMLSLEEMVASDALVRVIDAFVQAIDPDQLSFVIKGQSKEGRPAFDAQYLIGLYLYGYLNGVNSSRKLERECKRNVELWWLLHNQKPGYKTIANFRKDNGEAFRNLFNAFRQFCLSLGLYGRKTVAIDGSKFRAQNSKKNNYNIKKINENLDYIAKQEEYFKSLDSNDIVEKKLAKIEQRKDKYEGLKEQLENTEDTQISTTDPDARALPLHMNIVQVGYNLQTSVDDKNYLIADYQATNQKDHYGFAEFATRTRDALLPKGGKFTVLADKGYYASDQINALHNNGIETLVAPKKKSSKNKDSRVTKGNFKYSKKTDSYKCPRGKKLQRIGKTYQVKDNTPYTRYVADYSDCNKCPWRDICVSPSSIARKRGRYLNRNIYEDATDVNDALVKRKRDLYKRRQAIVEHPYGTIKRQWGITHTLMKGLKKVNGEFSIVLLCYNIKRVVGILGAEGLKKAFFLRNKLNLSTADTIKLLVQIVDRAIHGARLKIAEIRTS